MAKISGKAVKKTSWTASGIWLVVFLSFMVFELAVKPYISQPAQVWAEPFAMGFVFLVGGLIAFVIGTVVTIASWTMTADEHHDMLIKSSLSGKSSARLFLGILPKSYWLWQNRILTLLFTPFGLLLATVGAVILVKTYITYLK